MNIEKQIEILTEAIEKLEQDYQSKLEDLNVKSRILAEKEKILNTFFIHFIDKLAVDNAICTAEEEI